VTDHLIILPVILPALLAPLIVLAMRHDLTLQRVFGLMGSLLLVALSGWLIWSATAAGPQVYRLGDCPDQFSGTFHPSLCHRHRLGCPRQAFSCTFHVSADGAERRVPDRRCL
jgi:hypothetical protein